MGGGRGVKNPGKNKLILSIRNGVIFSSTGRKNRRCEMKKKKKDEKLHTHATCDEETEKKNENVKSPIKMLENRITKLVDGNPRGRNENWV